MKKIIALAVASAFVAPVWAADVTLTGDMEWRFTAGDDDGLSTVTDDADIFVTATEEVNGLSIKAVVGEEDMGAAGGKEAELHVSGSFGTVSIGTVSNAAAVVDEIVDVAGSAGADANPSHGGDQTENTIHWTLPALMDGLHVGLSMGVEAGTANTVDTDELETTSVGVKYSVNGLTAVYATIDVEDATYNTKHSSLSYSANGIFVGIAKTKDDGASNTDTQTVAVKYSLGDAAVYAEANESDASGTVTDTDIMGMSYSVGGGLSMFVEAVDSSTASSDATTLGIKYAF
jgi:hypothetical protein